MSDDSDDDEYNLRDYAFNVTYSVDVQNYSGYESDKYEDGDLCQQDDINVIESYPADFGVNKNILDDINKNPWKVFVMKPEGGSSQYSSSDYYPDFMSYEITYFKALEANIINIRKKCNVSVTYKSTSKHNYNTYKKYPYITITMDIPDNIDSRLIIHSNIPECNKYFTPEYRDGDTYEPIYAIINIKNT